MAESAATFLIKKLDCLLVGELKLVSNVRREARFIRDELQSMRAFLRDADRKEESDEGIKVLVDQVRQAAYDIEDVLDELLLTLPNQPRQQHGFSIGYHLQKFAWFIKNYKLQRDVATRIQEIKGRVEEISTRRKRYDFNSIEHKQGSSSNSMHDPRSDAFLLEEGDLVGIDNTKDDLIQQLVKEEPKLQVISVVGMGGLGKTTLVKKVYDDSEIKRRFTYQALIMVSQSFRVEDLLKDMFGQFYKKDKQPIPVEIETMNVVALKKEMKNFLQEKRYVVVLDDIWRVDAWDALKYAFPNSNCGSRIIITTRSKDIGKVCGHVYELQPLPQHESWELFCVKAFQSQTCPPHLKDLSEKLLERCGGLPLAIATLGSLLSTKEKSVIEWELTDRSLGTELQSNDHLSRVKRILYLSYIDLPYDLKYCFLYLSIFHESRLIVECKRLVRLWSAEQFIQEKGRMTIEEVAENYLNQLINRSLIQIIGTHDDGRPRLCRIHDLMAEIILSKSTEERFGAIATVNISRIPENVRRLSIRNDEIVPQNCRFSHLHSLFMFVAPHNDSSMLTFLGGLRFLRVLDLNNVPLMEEFLEEVVRLIYLRYLSMRRTKIEKLPNSIGKLQNLETLDLKGTNISDLPCGISKLKRLRYLAIYSYRKNALSYYWVAKGFKAFKGIGDLVSLQKLTFIEVDQGSDLIRELAKLSQLRRLGVVNLKAEDNTHLCSSIEKMIHLRSLTIHSMKEEILGLQYLISPPPFLQRLSLRGRMEELPGWISSLDNLVQIILCGSRLRDDPLDSIKGLPKLHVLCLEDACEGETLCFKAGGFQNLKYLRFASAEQLRLIQVEKGALIHLQELDISGCRALEKVPLGIECLVNLHELWLYNVSNEFIQSIDSDKGADHWRIAHIPSIFIDGVTSSTKGAYRWRIADIPSILIRN